MSQLHLHDLILPGAYMHTLVNTGTRDLASYITTLAQATCARVDDKFREESGNGIPLVRNKEGDRLIDICVQPCGMGHNDSGVQSRMAINYNLGLEGAG